VFCCPHFFGTILGDFTPNKRTNPKEEEEEQEEEEKQM
jgi:hypothetical protein